jgi:hypothetical protein
MSFDSKVTQLGAVSRFCVGRFSDYTELFSIELRQACDRLVRDVIILAALAVAGLFTLAFMCAALIASVWITPYFMWVVWGVAGAGCYCLPLLSWCSRFNGRYWQPAHFGMK